MKRFLQCAVTAALAAGALVSAAAPADATVIAEGVCREDSIVRVCIRETGPTNVSQELYAVENGDEIPIGSVAAYRDRYQLGSINFSCVRPVVNGTSYDACGGLGATLVETITILDETQLSAHGQRLKVIDTVYVCEAKLTATVLGDGVNGEDIFTVCADKGVPPAST